MLSLFSLPQRFVQKDRGGHRHIERFGFPEHRDPDEFVRKNGREAFEKLIRDAVPATDFKLEILEQGFDLSDDLQVLDYIRRCVPVLRSLGAVEQNIYIKRLASRFGLTEEAITLEVRTEDGQVRRPSPQAGNRPRDRRQQNSDGTLRLELSLIVLAIYNAGYLARFEADQIAFRTAAGRKIYGIMRDVARNDGYRGMEMDRRRIFEALDPEEEVLLNRALDTIRIGPDDEVFYQECRSKYALSGFKERRLELVNELQVAEKVGNQHDVEKIISELKAVDEMIRKVRKD